MVSTFKIALALAVCSLASPALAQDDGPRFCPNRPGLGSSTCTTEAGRLGAELGVADWTLNKTDSGRSDSVALGDSFLRYGLDDRTELQIGFVAYTHVYDRIGASVVKDGGFSDVRLGLRRNLIGNDGGDIALAIEPYVTLPAGQSAVSDGDWSAGLVVPSSFSLGGDLSLGATAIVAAAVDEDGDGHHFSATQYLGLSHPLSPEIGLTGEVGLRYDDDPAGDVWAPVASASLSWTPRDLWQFDIGTVIGLEGDSDDAEFYIGLSTLF
jgi:hypothetical protein